MTGATVDAFFAGRPGFAPAKINLTLRVGPPGADGRHPLDSLVAFARDAGDVLEVAPADGLSLEIAGPFAEGLDAGDDNLVVRAARALAAEGGVPARARMVLHKRLPVASGIGGGSADAAAALRTLRDLWALDLDDDDLERVAAPLGADVPACVTSRAARMIETGEALAPVSRLPDLHAVLINPAVACPTGAVYRAFDARGVAPPLVRARLPAFGDVVGLLAWLRTEPNDLEAAAIGLAPSIAEALDVAERLPGARLARMSGSGATVFALFDDARAASAAATAAGSARPGWWVCATGLAGRRPC